MADTPEWEPTVQKTVVQLRSVLTQLNKIWEEIGLNEDARSMYYDQAFKHIGDLLNDMLTESQQRKEALLQNSQELIQQISILSKELGMVVPISGYENLHLKEIEEELRTELHKLQYHKEQRLVHLNELLTKERSICKVLGTQPIGLEEHLPSEEELNNFKFYLEKQEGEKNRLESIFKDMRRSIVKMMDDLGVTPSSNFEHVVYKDPNNFVCSTNNMTKLRELRDQVKEQADEAKQHVEDMRQELTALWKYLDEPEHVCESFLNSYVGYSIATRNALSAEVKRCKEKRRQNIARYVTQIRNELMKLWDLCKYGEDQRKKFIAFNCNTYTEDLLTLHEMEVERIQKFYETNKPIFELLEERESLWTKMKELLRRANDPDRFYNRGGQLLTEEKERKTIQKKLPKIEEQLKQLIGDYESTHGEMFTVNGVTIEELLKESWENLNEEKETIKKARKEAKDKSVKKATLSASKKATLSASKKAAGILTTRRHTPVSASKRKLLFSPSPNSSIKRRNLSVVVNGSKVRRSGKVSRRLLQSGNKTFKQSQKTENSTSQSSAVVDTTYSQFKEHLEERRELRSSLLPERVLQNANKSNKMRTPVRTPAKPLRKNLLTPTTPTAASKLSQSQSNSVHRTPRSPRIAQTPRLAPVSTPLPIIF